MASPSPTSEVTAAATKGQTDFLGAEIGSGIKSFYLCCANLTHFTTRRWNHPCGVAATAAVLIRQVAREVRGNQRIQGQHPGEDKSRSNSRRCLFGPRSHCIRAPDQRSLGPPKEESG